MMDDANLGARIMAASGGGLEALLNTTENFITVPRHEFSLELTTTAVGDVVHANVNCVIREESRGNAICPYFMNNRPTDCINYKRKTGCKLKHY